MAGGQNLSSLLGRAIPQQEEEKKSSVEETKTNINPRDDSINRILQEHGLAESSGVE
jgi:hypothetical protein